MKQRYKRKVVQDRMFFNVKCTAIINRFRNASKRFIHVLKEVTAKTINESKP